MIGIPTNNSPFFFLGACTIIQVQHILNTFSLSEFTYSPTKLSHKSYSLHNLTHSFT